MSEYTRRRLLAIGGAATVAGLAGCSGAQNTADAETESSAASSGSALESIALENLHDQPHTLDIIIQRNDEIAYWTTHELAAISEDDSSITLDSELPTEPGPFQLTVRLDDNTRAQFSSTQLSDRDCLELLVMVTRAGDLSILTEVSGDSCSTDSEDADSSEQ